LGVFEPLNSRVKIRPRIPPIWNTPFEKKGYRGG
jgi:hypothetical protein